MNERALRILEYDKIIALLSEEADSAPGRAQCAHLAPLSDIHAVKDALENTADAVARIFRKGSVSFGSNRELKDALRALSIGATLDMRELLQIASLCENAGRVKAHGREDGEEDKTDSLSAYFEALEPLRPLSDEIRRCILSEEEIAPDASPALKKIRREMSLTGERIHSTLNNMVNGSARNYLQDPVVTLRGDRYCLPVRAEHKGQVKGIVHDASSSGQTLFIEPAQVVELNNRLRELNIEEVEEIARILAELSAKAAEEVPLIEENIRALTFLDFTYAKARLALSMNAMAPVVKEDRSFDLKNARHPLIDKDKVVPIDVHMGGDFNMLIITGPNTGGKTVTLKTVGLLTLMGLSGLMIPAGDRSEIAMYREIYADIGDEQSIEQSLSTFSAHMTNTVSILEQATEEDLCIFDELGAGTDPTEGAALAISILNDLHARGVSTMATTHYSELKVYALGTEGVLNASCEFDVATLRPTYRLLIGLPGKSNAFAISEKLGLPKRIIDAASGQIHEDAKKFEDLIADLEMSRKQIEEEQEEIRRYREEAERLRTQLSDKSRRMDASRDEILADAEAEALAILQDAKKYADETIRYYRKHGGDSMQEMERARTRLNEQIAAQNEKRAQRDKKEKKDVVTGERVKAETLKVGDTVRIVSMDMTGTVNSLPDKKGNLYVFCGSMRMKTNVGDLVTAQPEPEEKEQKKGFDKKAHRMDLSGAASISTEINLIGKNSDDAIQALSKYLDEAYMAHLPTVRVVHGKGEGILRKAVQRYLKGVRYVKSYKLGEFGEGDSGVTVVTFK